MHLLASGGARPSLATAHFACLDGYCLEYSKALQFMQPYTIVDAFVDQRTLARRDFIGGQYCGAASWAPAGDLCLIWHAGTECRMSRL